LLSGAPQRAKRAEIYLAVASLYRIQATLPDDHILDWLVVARPRTTLVSRWLVMPDTPGLRAP